MSVIINPMGKGEFIGLFFVCRVKRPNQTLCYNLGILPTDSR